MAEETIPEDSLMDAYKKDLLKEKDSEILDEEELDE